MTELKTEILEVLYKIAKNNPNLQVIVKLHPDQQLNLTDSVKYEILAVSRKLPNFIGIKGVQKDIDGRDIVKSSDLIVGHKSTMLMEGIILDKPILVVGWGVAMNKVIPFYEFGACDAAKNENEFYSKIIKIVNGGEDISKYEKGRKKLVYKYLYKQDGKACERIFKAIDKLLKK